MTSGHFLRETQLFGRLGLYSSKYEIEIEFLPHPRSGRWAAIGARCFRPTAGQTEQTVSNGAPRALGEPHGRRAREIEGGASKSPGRSRRPRRPRETETGAAGIPRSDAARFVKSGSIHPDHSGKNARGATGQRLARLRNCARRASRRLTVRVPRSHRRSPCCKPSRTLRADRRPRRQN